MKERLRVLEAEPCFATLEPHCLRLLASCAAEFAVEEGGYLVREHEPASAFYLLQEGSVALEAHPAGQAVVVLQTLGPGAFVGWSWLLPPYLACFDARALTAVKGLRFDAEALRRGMDRHPVCGYALLKHFTALIVQRLQAARLQGLDIYADGDPADVP